MADSTVSEINAEKDLTVLTRDAFVKVAEYLNGELDGECFTKLLGIRDFQETVIPKIFTLISLWKQS